MTELARIRLKTLGWFILFPLPLIGVLPWWLHQRVEGPFLFEGWFVQWLGIWLILNGLGLAGWCVHLFQTQGQGTPVPLDPPKRFVATGPYRFVRNPMMLSLFLILAGEVALYRSGAVFLYLLLAITVMHLFIRLWEEPDLQRRFGASYDAYRRQVPRWIPRLPTKS